jgi:hypothetical protein
MKIAKLLGGTLGVAVAGKAGYKLFLRYGLDIVLTDDQIGRIDKFILEDSDEQIAAIFDKIDRHFEKSTQRMERNRKARQARIQTRKDREEFFEFQKECKTIGDYIILMDKANELALTDPLMKKAADDLNLAMKKYI